MNCGPSWPGTSGCERTQKRFMSLQSVDEFRQLVLREPSLQERLRQPMDVRQFFELVLCEGKERGFEFTPEELQQALNASRRAWLERWI